MAGQSPPKRPRLSLQITPPAAGPGTAKSRVLDHAVQSRSPATLGTRASFYPPLIDGLVGTPAPVSAEPITAIRMKSNRLPELPRLQVPTTVALDHKTNTPYVNAQLPDTPLTAMPPLSPAVAMELNFSSTMTATPPLSAGAVEPVTQPAHVFCFSPADIQRHAHGGAEDGMTIAEDSGREAGFAPSESSQVDGLLIRPNARSTSLPPQPPSAPVQVRLGEAGANATTEVDTMPYVHPRALHSILRNSPLPPLPPYTAVPPVSPRRQSQRLLERASRHVMYNSPLTQTITTNLYTKSHIDLLCEEASPFASPASASPLASDSDVVLDWTRAYGGSETQDGGETPGPLEEMRRCMAGLGTSSAVTSAVNTPTTPTTPTASTALAGGLSRHGSGGIRKRKLQLQPQRHAEKSKDKKRRWVWTLGQDDDEEATLSGAMVALKAAQRAEEAARTEARKATERQGAEVATEARTEDETEAEADPETPLARRAAVPIAELGETPPADRDVDMDDVSSTAADDTQAAATKPASSGEAEAPATDTRKRKSTPIPYASDDSDDGDGGGDDDGDHDMRSPTAALGDDLQGVWLQAAATATARMAADTRPRARSM